MRDIPLAVPERVDKVVLRLDLSSPMQQVLEEVLEGVLDKVLGVVHLKEVPERVLVVTLGEGLEYVPEGLDLLLLHPLCGTVCLGSTHHLTLGWLFYPGNVPKPTI